MDAKKSYKQLLGEYVVDTFVRDDMVIGLGTGSTAIWAVKAIGRKLQNKELKNICCAVTGPGTALEAAQFNLPVFNLNSPAVREFDITIDGADECDGEHNMIKGGGGCLLHEKLVAYNSKKFVCVIGSDKQVLELGKTFAVPVEVIPCALEYVKREIQKYGTTKSISLRQDARGVGPWITEEGNYILDVYFEQSFECAVREKELVQIVGVVEVGIFSQTYMRSKPVLCVYTQPENTNLNKDYIKIVE